MRNRSVQDPLEEEPCQEPPGGIVQTDDTMNVKTASGIVPGTEIVFPEQAATEIFHRKDHCHIEQPALWTTYMQFCKKVSEGRKQAGRTVDGKHPQGSIAGKLQISAFQGMKGSEYNFHTPAT